MSERIIMIMINVFTLLFLLIMQILIVRVSRKNILLGVRLPEEKMSTVEIKNIIKGYTRENILVGIPFLILIGILTYFIDNINFFVLSIFIYIGILFLVYLRWNKRLKKLKKEKEWDKLAGKVLVIDTKFSKDRGKEGVISPKWFLIPLAIIVFNLILTFIMYPSLPDIIPTHWDFRGNVDGYMNKSVMVALIIPISQIIIGITLYLSYYFMMKSKQQINSKNPELSIKKNTMFRRVWSIYFIVTLIVLELVFTWTNMVSLGITNNMKVVSIIQFIIFGILIIWSIYLSLKVGQGGDRLKLDEEKDISSNFDLDDDNLWKLGNLIYYNKNDTSIFVEKRVGVGWTVNAGRPIGIIILILPIIIIIVSLILTNR